MNKGYLIELKDKWYHHPSFRKPPSHPILSLRPASIGLYANIIYDINEKKFIKDRCRNIDAGLIELKIFTQGGLHTFPNIHEYTLQELMK